MTYAEFLQRLAETPRDWRVNDEGMIRRNNDSECPISSLCGAVDLAFRQVSQRLGIGISLSYRIAEAADFVDPKGEALKVRADLLKACGLQ